MKWNIFLGTLVLALGLSTQSFGFELLDRMLGTSSSCCDSGCDTGCCEPACGAEDNCCDDGCEASCGCEPACGAEDSCCDDGCDSGCDSACSKRCGGLLDNLFSIRIHKRSCCDDSCDASCGCEPACGAEDSCSDDGCEASCGCESHMAAAGAIDTANVYNESDRLVFGRFIEKVIEAIDVTGLFWPSLSTDRG